MKSAPATFLATFATLLATSAAVFATSAATSWRAAAAARRMGHASSTNTPSSRALDSTVTRQACCANPVMRTAVGVVIALVIWTANTLPAITASTTKTKAILPVCAASARPSWPACLVHSWVESGQLFNARSVPCRLQDERRLIRMFVENISVAIVCYCYCYCQSSGEQPAGLTPMARRSMQSRAMWQKATPKG